ncbi:MAG: DASS family sodium-coupled anion symporter [Candidatus Marinimicrobia bacterium]|nr:DASS family sodium-coupled anion symporter [Candidatus Neomarinimicrobiota bacterium]
MSAEMIFWVQQKRWLLIALAVGAILYFFVPHPQSLSLEAYHILIIMLMTLIMILKEPIPLPAIALQVIFWQVIIGGSTPNEVGGYFMSDAVFFMMGSLMLAVAIVSQGLDKRLALFLVSLTGNRTWRIVAGFTLTAALLSSVIGPHLVTAILLPVALTLIRFSPDRGKGLVALSAALLFAIAYGANVGSIGTPSGGPRNVIMMNYWQEFAFTSLSYLGWIRRVYPMVLLEIPFSVWIILKTFPPEQQHMDSAVRHLLVEVRRDGKISPAQGLTLVLLALMLLGWVFFGEQLGMGTIALIGVFLFMVTGLVQWKEISAGVNWGVVLLFASTISIGVQMKNTGAAIWLAEGSVSILGSLLPNLDWVRAILSVGLSVGMANLISPSATVAVAGPIVLNLGGDPILLGLASVIASAFGYFTAVAAPACTIIYSSGLVKAPDFLKAGWKMALMSILSLTVIALFWWPLFS